MTAHNEVDRYLLEQVRAGRSEAWSQLVDRYQGRLLSFARRQLGRVDDAEDAVQETFMRFLRSLDRFREQASLETYLFSILRRHLIDQFRGRRLPVFALQNGSPGDNDGADVIDLVPAAEPTASWHARQHEMQERLERELGAVLGGLAERLRHELQFQQLRIVELIFGAQLPNQRVAELLGVPQRLISVTKHRWMKRLARGLAERGVRVDDDVAALDATLNDATLLTRVWQQQRPTCPKRSTLGHYMLGTLEPDWHQFVSCHLQTLGCQFCRANLDDLEAQAAAVDPQPALRDRIMQSTVGFLRA